MDLFEECPLTSILGETCQHHLCCTRMSFASGRWFRTRRTLLLLQSVITKHKIYECDTTVLLIESSDEVKRLGLTYLVRN